MAARLGADFTRRFRGGPTIHGRFGCATDAGVTVLFGPSGSGKTTMLRCLAGVERPDQGWIRFGDETWYESASNEWTPPERRRVGMMHQDYALFPHLSVLDNVRYGIAHLRKPESSRRAHEVMEMLAISHLAARTIHGLSGGEQQRVALARSLAPKPRVLLLDEPLSALDGPARTRIRGELRSLLVTLGIPVLLVTHDRDEAFTLGDRACIILDGEVRQDDTVLGAFSQPRDPDVAEAVGFENIVPVERIVRDGAAWRVAASQHSLPILTDPPPAPSPNAPAVLCVRAEDVILDPHPSPNRSDSVPGVITACYPEGSRTRVTLNIGFALTALIPTDTARGLARGNTVYARLRPHAARFVPPNPRFLPAGPNHPRLSDSRDPR